MGGQGRTARTPCTWSASLGTSGSSDWRHAQRTEDKSAQRSAGTRCSGDVLESLELARQPWLLLRLLRSRSCKRCVQPQPRSFAKGLLVLLLLEVQLVRDGKAVALEHLGRNGHLDGGCSRRTTNPARESRGRGRGRRLLALMALVSKVVLVRLQEGEDTDSVQAARQVESGGKTNRSETVLLLKCERRVPRDGRAERRDLVRLDKRGVLLGSVCLCFCAVVAHIWR